MITMVGLSRLSSGVGRQGSRIAAYRRSIRRVALYTLVNILALSFMFPFLWSILTSLKAPHEVIVFPPQIFPERPRFENYRIVFEEVPFAAFYLNTTIVAVMSTIGAVVSTILVSFGFSRKRFPGRNILFFVVLSTMMLPGEVTLIPQFLLFKSFGWLDTFYPLVVPSYFGSAFAIFLMRQFFMTIPMDFDEAAMLDGASSLRILFTVLLPLMRPAAITVAILSFLGSWGDFFHPLIYLNTTEKLTLSVGLRWFSQGPMYAEAAEPKDQLLMAASLMSAVPCVVLFFLAQRYFVEGMVMSGIKG
jgi:ABC-type glycerol-3-phosphate transport system permease component